MCLMVLSKNLLFSTLGSKETCIEVCWTNGGLLKVALYTLGSNISAPRQKNLKNAQDVEMQCTWCSSTKLFFSWQLVVYQKKYKNTFLEMGLPKIALCTLSSNISAARQKFKKMPRMFRWSVLDDPLQNSSFLDTWLCQKKCIKVSNWELFKSYIYYYINSFESHLYVQQAIRVLLASTHPHLHIWWILNPPVELSKYPHISKLCFF